MAERLTPFFQLLKTTDTKAKILITFDVMKDIRDINEALDRCCQLALRQSLPGKQLVLIIDASFQAAGLCSVNRRRPEPKVHFSTQNLSSYSLWLKNILTISNQNFNLRKRIFSHLLAFIECGNIFWGSTKPVIIMTDSKSITRFFQTKMIPPPLWKTCDFVLQFSFTIAHIPGEMNTAADYLSRLELDPNEKRISNFRENIPTKPIEVNIESTVIAQEEPVFFDTTDQQETTEKNVRLIRKKQEMPYLKIQQSWQCHVFMQMTYTKSQQL